MPDLPAANLPGRRHGCSGTTAASSAFRPRAPLRPSLVHRGVTPGTHHGCRRDGVNGMVSTAPERGTVPDDRDVGGDAVLSLYLREIARNPPSRPGPRRSGCRRSSATAVSAPVSTQGVLQAARLPMRRLPIRRPPTRRRWRRARPRNGASPRPTSASWSSWHAGLATGLALSDLVQDGNLGLFAQSRSSTAARGSRSRRTPRGGFARRSPRHRRDRSHHRLAGTRRAVAAPPARATACPPRGRSWPLDHDRRAGRRPRVDARPRRRAAPPGRAPAVAVTTHREHRGELGAQRRGGGAGRRRHPSTPPPSRCWHPRSTGCSRSSPTRSGRSSRCATASVAGAPAPRNRAAARRQPQSLEQIGESMRLTRGTSARSSGPCASCARHPTATEPSRARGAEPLRG